ncbi:MAG: polysaccharide biosynthesis protein [Sphaerochaetaceae bacterium]|nr:polysaccharide biosynthesis protein [Sphaerochaetaceae bacterium]
MKGRRKKIINLVLLDYLIIAVANIVGFWLVRGVIREEDVYKILIFSLIYLLFLMISEFYRIRIENSSIELVHKVAFSMVPAVVLAFFFSGIKLGFHSYFTRGIAVGGVFSCVGVIGARAVYRMLKARTSLEKASDRPLALVYGAGELGCAMARLSNKGKFEYKIAAFIDDDEKIQGSIEFDVPVIGTVNDLHTIFQSRKFSVLLIAVTGISSEKVHKAAKEARDAGVDVKIVPALFETRGRADVSVRDIDYADLLGRKLYSIDKEPLFDMIDSKTILVTGAGGSIGSEICKQVMDYNPKRLILLDIDETELHDLALRLLNYEKEWSEKVVPVVCDIRNAEKVERIFKEYKPDLVFHAAAYKHVPLMEKFPEEAVITNVCGSYNVFTAARSAKVSRVVVISTDKAVNPTNVMGCTKRIVEMMASVLNSKETEFCCVRFGNVIGSRGSMLPLFLEEIKAGRPITVTDRRIIRYFMAIPEAVSLVFRAASIAKGGEVMVLDMGEPVKIYDFAQRLIDVFGDGRSSIKVVGLRPGEKLYEELLVDKDNTIPTEADKIFKARIVAVSEFTEKSLKEFTDSLKTIKPQEVDPLLRKLVPEYDHHLNKNGESN